VTYVEVRFEIYGDDADMQRALSGWVFFLVSTFLRDSGFCSGM
jgi:hypothetical protein